MSVFSQIISGKIPCFKIYESDTAIAFLDINPLSSGHTLVVPKHDAERLHELPHNILLGTTEALSIVSKALTEALGCSDYNIIQNNGKIAGQEVMHVHFHIIPKPDKDQGLGLYWPMQKEKAGVLKTMAAMITNHIPHSTALNECNADKLKKGVKQQTKQTKEEKSHTSTADSNSVPTNKARDERLDQLEKQVEMLTKTMTILMKGTNSRGQPATFVTAKCPITGKNASLHSGEVSNTSGKCPITGKTAPTDPLPNKNTTNDTKKHLTSSNTKPFSLSDEPFSPQTNKLVSSSSGGCQVPKCECTETPTDCAKPCSKCKHGAVYHSGFHAIKMQDPDLFEQPVSGDNMTAISKVCAQLCEESEQRQNKKGWPGSAWIKKVESALKDCSSASTMKAVRSKLIETGGGLERAVVVIEKELGYELGEAWRDPFMSMGCPFGFDKIPKRDGATKEAGSGGKCPFGFDR